MYYFGFHSRGSPAGFLKIRFHYRGNHRGYRGFLTPRITVSLSNSRIKSSTISLSASEVNRFAFVYNHLFLFLFSLPLSLQPIVSPLLLCPTSVFLSIALLLKSNPPNHLLLLLILF